MINETIIKSLGLIDKGVEVNGGANFMYKTQCLVWPLTDRAEVFVRDCDWYGKPLPGSLLKVSIIWRKPDRSKWSWDITIGSGENLLQPLILDNVKAAIFLKLEEPTAPM